MAKRSQSPFFWFSIFNMFILMSVFMGRILRDAHLFTAPGGERLLPVVFVVNAVVITWVGSQLGDWYDRSSRRAFFTKL